MALIQLPEEIIILIVKKLDMQSQINLHETCSYFNTVVARCGVVKVCTIPAGPLASPSTLKLAFFNGIAEHLNELNLCAVHSLTKSMILPAIKKLKRLKTLDVSYTSIILPDLVDIQKLCSTLRNISINFLFGKFKTSVRIPQKMMLQCQDVFQHFQNVEFVGVKGNLLQSQLPLYLLKKANSLNKVKFTVIQSNHTIYHSEDCDHIFQFNYLQLLNWNKISGQTVELDDYSVIIPMLDISKIEYTIIIQLEHTITMVQNIWTSDIFKNFFEQNYGKSSHIEQLNTRNLNSNLVYFIWNKDTTTFNEFFFSKLSSHLHCIFPHQKSSSGITESTPIPKCIDWLVIHLDYKPAPLHKKSRQDSNEPITKKQRLGLSNYVLDFDDYLKDINSIKLTYKFHFSPTVCLTSTLSYLRKLTYLNLTGRANFSGDFFKTLFLCCDKLETLNVEPKESRSTTMFISNSICLSSSLKNFRLVECIYGNSINVLLTSISKCKCIENLHIFNNNAGITELHDLSLLVAKCAYIHSIYIRNKMSDNNLIKVLRFLNNAKVKHTKPYINVELYSNDSGESYNPYIAVFYLNTIKLI